MRASFEWLLQQSGPVDAATHCFAWVPGEGWRTEDEAAAAAAGAVHAQLAL